MLDVDILYLPAIELCRHAAWNPPDQRLRLQEDLRNAGEPRLPDQPAERDPPAEVADRRGTIENPFNCKDFQDDKLSVLDIKAVDRTGAIYDVEVQLTTYEGLVQRMVFYGCELYAGQVSRERSTRPSIRSIRSGWSTASFGRTRPGPPCLSPDGQGIGAGLGRNTGDSHAGTGEV